MDYEDAERAAQLSNAERWAACRAAEVFCGAPSLIGDHIFTAADVFSRHADLRIICGAMLVAMQDRRQGNGDWWRRLAWIGLAAAGMTTTQEQPFATEAMPQGPRWSLLQLCMFAQLTVQSVELFYLYLADAREAASRMEQMQCATCPVK